jgi:predicted dinucleotide-binding enzyme
MNVTLVGAGNMGSAFAKQLTQAGHAVRVSARHPEKAQALAAEYDGATAADPGEALGDSEVVIVATYYDDAAAALRTLGPLAGKVVVDISNPVTADFMRLAIGHDTSAAEEIAKAIPEATVVKAFNTLFAQLLADGPAFAGGAVAPVFYAGDSDRAKEVVKALIESIGFQPVDAGGLANARYLEPLGGLNVYFGYGAGLGTSIAPAWISKS